MFVLMSQNLFLCANNSRQIPTDGFTVFPEPLYRTSCFYGRGDQERGGEGKKGMDSSAFRGPTRVIILRTCLPAPQHFQATDFDKIID